MEKIIFERKRFEYVGSKRKQVKDFMILKNFMSKTIQVEIRVEGYLLDLLILKEMSTEFYNLDFLSLPYDVNIDVTEVVEDVDLTVYKNNKYREFNFFKNICKWYFWKSIHPYIRIATTSFQHLFQLNILKTEAKY